MQIKGISRHYFYDESVSRSDAREVAAAWAPYCSVATWYIWRSLDPLPIAGGQCLASSMPNAALAV